MSWKMCRDVPRSASLLCRDVISSTSSVKIAKKRLKTPSIEPGKGLFVQCFLIFCPKIPLKHLYFADFMAIYGRLWQLKEPLPCQYILIIRQLQNSMAIWQFLKDRHNYNITDRKVLILFNIPPIAENKKGEP